MIGELHWKKDNASRATRDTRCQSANGAKIKKTMVGAIDLARRKKVFPESSCCIPWHDGLAHRR
jgi:hypothetical protein